MGYGLAMDLSVQDTDSDVGMLEEVKKVAHDNEQAALRDHRLGLIAYHDFTKRGPAWLDISLLSDEYILTRF